MTRRETSVSEGQNEFRARVGLQFFAEGEDTSGAADTDATGGDDGVDSFLAALTGNQREGEETGGGGHDDAGNQRTEEQQQDAEEQTADQTEQTETKAEDEQPADAGATAEPKPPVVPLTYNGRKIPLPAEAVDALAGVIGHDPVELLQKGMNYESKAEREVRLLDEFAKQSHMTREAYLAQLESTLAEQRVQDEAARVMQEMPGVTEEVARNLAQQRVAVQREQEKIEQQKQMQAAQAAQMRVQQQVQAAQQQAEMKAWDEYEKIADVHKPEDIPERVMELVKTEGLTPIAAHYKYENEQLEQQLQVQKKEKQNAARTTGSMAGADDTHDAFLAALLGN